MEACRPIGLGLLLAFEGFGTSFIKCGVEYELGGQLTPELAPIGLHYLIKLPLRPERGIGTG